MDAKVKITIEEAEASEKLKRLASEFAKVGKSASAMGDTQSASSLNRASSGLKSIAGSFTQAEKDAKRATSAFDTAAQSVKAFGSGLGLPMVGGIVAAAGVLGAAVANSIRLAYEFQRVSQMSTFAMSANASSMLSTLSNFKSEALGMADIGIGGINAAKMMGSYSLSSGKSLGAGQGHEIGTYAQVYGLDQQSFAGSMGTLAQYAGGNVGANMSAAMGGASESGDFGRRQMEFIGVATGVLAGIQSNNPFSKDGLKDAIREISGISQGGAYFQSSQGMQNTLAGFQGLGKNLMSPGNASLAMRSGLSVEDIVTGTQSPEKLAKLAAQVYKESQGNKILGISSLHGYGIQGDQANDLWARLEAGHGKVLGNYSPGANPAERLAKAQESGALKIQQAGAAMENVQIRFGNMLTDVFAGSVRDFALAVDRMTGGQGNKSVIDTAKDNIGSAAKAVGDWMGIGTGPGTKGRKDLMNGAIQSAHKYGIDPIKFMDMIQQESQWDTQAVSSAGAKGIGQLTLGGEVFGKTPTKGDQAHAMANPYWGMDVAAAHLSRLVAANHGDYAAAYNMYNSGSPDIRGTDHQNYSNDVISQDASVRKQLLDVPGGRLILEARFISGSNNTGSTNRNGAYKR